MTTTLRARTPLALACFALALCGSARGGDPSRPAGSHQLVPWASPLSLSEARADEASAPPAGATSSQCTLKGTLPGPKGTPIHDAAQGGRVIATLTGALLPLRMSQIPTDPTQGRAKIQTSDGAAAVRIEGYAAPSSFRVYTAKDVPVVADHVWISSGHEVKLTKAQGAQLTAQRTIAGSNAQQVSGTAGCDAFTLARVGVTAQEVPGNGRGYTMKRSSIDLHDDADGDVVFTLQMTEGAGQLFWSTETRAGFVHVLTRSDVTIDAWAKVGALDPLKKGEMMDPVSPAVAVAQLRLDKPPPLRTATKDIPIRARRDAGEKAIGVIEAGAEFYPMETVAGWTKILPKHLGFTPPDEGGFWVASADVSP
jgi:hypothetical protein